MSSQNALLILRLVVGVVAGGYGAALAWARLQEHTHWPLLVLGVAELVAAGLLLVPRTLRFGGVALLIIFAFAAAFHLLHGEYNLGYLAVYAAATLTVISDRRPA